MHDAASGPARRPLSRLRFNNVRLPRRISLSRQTVEVSRARQKTTVKEMALPPISGLIDREQIRIVGTRLPILGATADQRARVGREHRRSLVTCDYLRRSM